MDHWRGWGKAIARVIATMCVVPEIASWWFRGRLLGEDRALESSSQMLAQIPGLVGQYMRRAFYSHVLDYCDRTAVIEYGTLISKRGARIEENAYIGPYCHLGLVHIERNVLIAPAVQIPSGQHAHGDSHSGMLPIDQSGPRTLVTIGEGTWIGASAVIMANVGRETIIGAGAVVTADVPDRVLAGGVPARIIRRRDESS